MGPTLDVAMLVRVLLIAVILIRRGIIGLSITLVVVAILFTPEVDVLGVTLGVLAHEEGNDFLDQSFDLSGLVVAFAKVDFCHGLGCSTVVAWAVARFEGRGEGMGVWLCDVSDG